MGEEFIPAGRCRNTWALKPPHSWPFSSVGVLLCASPPHTMQGAVEAWSLTCQSQLSRRALIPNYQAGQNHGTHTHMHSHPPPYLFQLISTCHPNQRGYQSVFVSLTQPPPNSLLKECTSLNKVNCLTLPLSFSCTISILTCCLLVKGFISCVLARIDDKVEMLKALNHKNIIV